MPPIKEKDSIMPRSNSNGNSDGVVARVIPPKSEKDLPGVEVKLNGKTYNITTGPGGTSAAKAFAGSLNGKKYEYKLPKIDASTKKIHLEWVIVTPEMALEWLANGVEDRRFHMSRVNRYASIQAQKGWLPVVEGISFDERGRRINGKHRLAAIVVSGIPTLLLIARNVPVEAQKGYDQNLTRNAADWLLHEYPLIPKKEDTSPILRHIMLLAAGGVGNQYTPDTAHIIAGMYEQDLIWIKKVIQKDREVNEVPLFKNSDVRTALAIAHHFEKKATIEVVNAIIDGDNLRVGTPARTLKDFLANLKTKVNLTSDEKTFAVLRAIQAHLTGEKLGKSIPRTAVDVVDAFSGDRRSLIPEGTFLPEFGKKSGYRLAESQ